AARPTHSRLRRLASSLGGVRHGSSPRVPTRIVFRAKPVASATEVAPPQPKSDASVAAHCRRIRSSIRSESERYLRRIRLMLAVSCVNSYSSPFQKDATQIAQVIISRFLSKDLQNSTGQRRGFSFRYPTLFLQSINQFY